jgi:hypothetical protein
VRRHHPGCAFLDYGSMTGRRRMDQREQHRFVIDHQRIADAAEHEAAQAVSIEHRHHHVKFRKRLHSALREDCIDRGAAAPAQLPRPHPLAHRADQQPAALIELRYRTIDIVIHAGRP